MFVSVCLVLSFLLTVLFFSSFFVLKVRMSPLFIKGYLTWQLHPFNGLFSKTTWVSRYQKVKTSLDLNQARDDGGSGCSGIRWAICKQSAPRSRQDNHTNTPTLNFYKPDTLPGAQPTVSKHWWQRQSYSYTIFTTQQGLAEAHEMYSTPVHWMCWKLTEHYPP